MSSCSGGSFCWGTRVFVILLLSGLITSASAQTQSQFVEFGQPNTIGIFGAYSNDSSHILLGQAEQRKLFQFGISYSRRLILTHRLNWQYDAEFMPVVLEGDPLVRFVNTQTSPTSGTYTGTVPYPMIQCAPVTSTYDYTLNGVVYSGTEVETCYGRRWTVGQALSPVGTKVNFLPRSKLQPFVIGHGGYMFSTTAIPVEGAGSFNFTFDLGAGLEYFVSRTRSVRVEYRYHHFSNAETALSNPGVDNGVLQVTYSFWP